MAKLGPFGLIPETEDFLEEELRDLRLKMEHPEEWEEKERKRKEAAEIARRKVEEAKNLPADYFDGWYTYTIQKGDCIASIVKRLIMAGELKGTLYALEMEVVKNNDRQLPFKGHSIVPGMKLRIRRKETEQMNKVILMGRLTRDPEVRYSQGEQATAVARYTLAVDRRGRNQENSADFIACVAFGKAAEFAERYLHKGTKIVLTGRIQTGSYTNKDGQRVYTTDIVAEDQEFAESKNTESSNAGGYNTQPAPAPQSGNDGFMPAGDDSELPFVQEGKG